MIIENSMWTSKAALLRLLDHVPDDASLLVPNVIKFFMKHGEMTEWGDLNTRYGVVSFYSQHQLNEYPAANP